ncbi:hypothetical protein DFJ74DRAFT_679871 [Hyaloraphidium curvatum]|nr:hypothetical protein DFJ74DRAFT_679871 [Hyaloraphidium curvatum]
MPAFSLEPSARLGRSKAFGAGRRHSRIATAHSPPRPRRSCLFSLLKYPSTRLTMSALWANYLVLLDAHPLRTKALTAAAIAATGDVCAQIIEHRRKARATARAGAWHWDRRRTARLGFYGLAVGGPITHLWYLVLEAIYGASATLRSSLAKMATDQIVAAPAFTAAFFAVNAGLEGKGTREIGERVRRDLWGTLKANWALWPAALTLNFLFVPQPLRVLYVNALGLVWGSYLSMVQNRPDASAAEGGIALEDVKL